MDNPRANNLTINHLNIKIMTAEQKLTEIINLLRWGSIDYDDYGYTMGLSGINGSSKIKLTIQLKGLGKNLTYLKCFTAKYFTQPDIQLCPGTTVIMTITDDLWDELATYALAEFLEMRLEKLLCTIDIINVMDTPSLESTVSVIFNFKPNVPLAIEKSIISDLAKCRGVYPPKPVEYKGERYDVKLNDSIVLYDHDDHKVYTEFSISKIQ